MSALKREIRKMSAREAAERLNCSPRYIRQVVAEPREEYLARAAERRDRVLALREQGMKHREIAEQLGIKQGTVSAILWHAKRRQDTATSADIIHLPV
jgi:DNA-directed RNA polymerase specialized sigma24 family protein